MFEAYDPNQGRLDLTPATNAHATLSSLVDHDGLGFAPKEIHEGTDDARGSVGPTPKRLAQHDLLRHEGEYWAAAADDRLAAIAGLALSTNAVEERFGDDRYGRNPDRSDDLPDLGERDEERSDARDAGGRATGKGTWSWPRTRSAARRDDRIS